MPQLNYPFRAVEFFFDALANPFATEWVPLTREDLIPNNSTGVNLEIEGLSGEQVWWNLVVQPRGEVFYGADGETPSLADVLSSDDRLVSMMKVEIEYTAGNGKINRRRMDVGTGVDIFVTPTANLQARILIPDPDSVPAQLPPTMAPRRDLRVAADVMIGVECVAAPVGRDDALYTQPFYTIPGDPDQAGFEAEIQRGAKEAQLFSDIPVSGSAEFIFDRSPFDSTEVGSFFTASAPGDNTASEIVIIPQIADILRYTPTNGPAVITLVQRLKF